MMRRNAFVTALALSLGACSTPLNPAPSAVASLDVPSAVLRTQRVFRFGNAKLGALEQRDPDRMNGRVYVATSWQTGTILIYPLMSKARKFIGVFADLLDPRAAAVDARGNVYATDDLTSTISIFHPRAISPFRVLKDPYVPEGIAVDGAGNVYAAAILDNEITVFAAGSKTPTGKLADKQLVSPFFVAPSPNGDIYADGLNCQWGSYYCRGGTVIGYFKLETGHFTRRKLKIGFPGGLTVDPHGNLFVVDQAPSPSAGSVLDVFPPGATQPSKIYQLGRSDSADILTVAFDQHESRFFTADWTNGASEEYAYPSGTYLGSLVIPNWPYTMVQSLAIGPPNVP